MISIARSRSDRLTTVSIQREKEHNDLSEVTYYSVKALRPYIAEDSL